MRAAGWAVLWLLGLLLVVLGATGRLGVAFGAIITPALLMDTPSANGNTSSNS